MTRPVIAKANPTVVVLHDEDPWLGIGPYGWLDANVLADRVRIGRRHMYWGFADFGNRRYPGALPIFHARRCGSSHTKKRGRHRLTRGEQDMTGCTLREIRACTAECKSGYQNFAGQARSYTPTQVRTRLRLDEGKSCVCRVAVRQHKPTILP